jgi:small-conductance mechanosensitive channel
LFLSIPYSVSFPFYTHCILYSLISIYKQARIQTQEIQIIECEAALKTRNEELKTLRSDNTDLTEKCETLDLSLQASIENAKALKGQLSVSEVL